MSAVECRQGLVLAGTQCAVNKRRKRHAPHAFVPLRAPVRSARTPVQNRDQQPSLFRALRGRPGGVGSRPDPFWSPAPASFHTRRRRRGAKPAQLVDVHVSVRQFRNERPCIQAAVKAADEAVPRPSTKFARAIVGVRRPFLGQLKNSIQNTADVIGPPASFIAPGDGVQLHSRGELVLVGTRRYARPPTHGTENVFGTAKLQEIRPCLGPIR
jgi:hypothetical protein